MKKNVVIKMNLIRRDSMKLFFITFSASFLVGLILLFNPPTFSALGKVTGITESVDPNELLVMIKAGDSSIKVIDIRSKQDFNKGHIKSASSFPLYTDSGQVIKIDRELFDGFRKLYPDKKNSLILYGHFSGTEVVYKLRDELRRRHVNAAALTIGWNEWRHFRNLWLPESMWDKININDFVTDSN
jgi:rhodanese-related sulfurtransferase